MLKIALPNKGSLSDEAVKLVSKAGYRCRRKGRELSVYDESEDIEFIYLRPTDIPLYVGNGVLDLGITGKDISLDSSIELTEIKPLGFGKSRFMYAVDKDKSVSPDDFSGYRIATSYPNLVKRDMGNRGIRDFSVIELDGAIEISIKLGIADAIADVVESGRTLKEAGMKTVGDPVMISEAVLIGRSSCLSNEAVNRFLKRLEGILLSREYVMVEYDIPENDLERASKITPGIESPTISPLSEKGWFAVKSMCRSKGINKTIDRLSNAGAKGIIVSEIKTCRI